MKKLVYFLPLLIVLVACLLELAATTKAVQSIAPASTGTVYSIPSHRQVVCELPSVENGYVETSKPVKCVNDPQRTATQSDINAGVYAAPDPRAQYEYWYATDAVRIHHSQYLCYVVRVDGSLLCDPREYDGDLVEPTDEQLADWQDYQNSLGGPCIYAEPDECDSSQN